MKKAGVTHKKRNQKREREKAAEREPQTYLREINGTWVLFRGFLPGAKLSEQQLQAERRRVLQRIFPRSPRRPVRSGKTILYCGKLDQIWGTPLGAAKWIAEEIRTSPQIGWRLLMWEVERRGNVKGFVSKMLKALGKYLEDQQPLFDKMDYDIVSILEQHPHYAVKEIAAELSKTHPKTKFDTLEKRVRRLLKPK